tara:strand:- start:318 stop:653 length:336 start_codon:yes stop_codon:yes gene_type:complete
MFIYVVTSVCESKDRGPDSSVLGIFTDKYEADLCVRREFEAFEIQGYTKFESWHGGSFNPKGYNPRGFRVTIRDGVRMSISVDMARNVAFNIGLLHSNEHPDAMIAKGEMK